MFLGHTAPVILCVITLYVLVDKSEDYHVQKVALL